MSELITFFIAGHGTTALAFTSTFFLLANNKEILRTTQKELDSIEDFNLKNLKSCSYLRAVTSESMRLLPAVYMINRANKDWAKFVNYDFAPHTQLFLLPNTLKRYWKNPEEFMSERFLEKNLKVSFPLGMGREPVLVIICHLMKLFFL